MECCFIIHFNHYNTSKMRHMLSAQHYSHQMKYISFLLGSNTLVVLPRLSLRQPGYRSCCPDLPSSMGEKCAVRDSCWTYFSL